MNELMLKYENQIKTFMLNYFHNGYFTKDESSSFLKNYLNYILLYNEIDPDKVTVYFHCVKSLPKNISALTTFSGNDKKLKENKIFDVYFLEDMMFCKSYFNSKNFNKLICLKEKNKTLVNELINQLNLAKLIIKAGHEFQHVVQIVKQTSKTAKISDYFKSVEQTIMIGYNLENKDRQTRRILKNYTNYLKSLKIISSVEINADAASKVYCNYLFGNIYETIKDKDEQEFLNILYWRCKNQYKIRKVNHAIGNELYNQAKENLISKYGFKEDDLFIP